MTLEAFATKHRLKLRRSPDDDNEPVISGKQGQIYEYSDNELAVSFTPGLKNGHGIGAWCPKKWGNLRRAALAAGLTLQQNGDSEGSLSFDPANREHARIAVQIAGARPKRLLSPEHKARLLAVSPIMRNLAKSPILNGQLSA